MSIKQFFHQRWETRITNAIKNSTIEDIAFQEMKYAIQRNKPERVSFLCESYPQMFIQLVTDGEEELAPSQGTGTMMTFYQTNLIGGFINQAKRQKRPEIVKILQSKEETVNDLLTKTEKRNFRPVNFLGKSHSL